ncbi:multidrug effflux MFS transporter [Neptunitalea lumnitzerae]|uniref:Bcr/CflA family drug resistance efflux transporter n=1 Tax=Neptunitalea lumnitzerae TaxID=2965509 RepID=A0ABQ5MLQ0_9FLAO|nr:multidrug effflux MFS transporter [Neptunitalea sp. Y10]GLB50327.1 Bcr/CflA family drug resistance efflux transporter [Neptunitalea sp. Y10]
MLKRIAQSQPKITTDNHAVIYYVLGTLIALGPFSIDMYLQAFENIATDFHTTKHAVELSLTSYFIGISLGQLAYGPIMDKYGRRNPQLIGLLIYIIAAFACYFATSLTWLVIARFFLAVGASAGMVASKAVVRDIFKNNMDVARAMSFLMLIMGAAPILAPYAGQLVVNHFNWEYIFLFLGGFSILMFFNVLFLLPESSTPNKKVSLKPLSILDKYIGILSNPEFFTFSIAGGFTIGAMFAYVSDAAILFQDVYGIENFGLLVGLNALGLIAGSQINRYIIKKIGVLQLTLKISIMLIIIAVLFLINVLTFNNFYASFVLLFIMMTFLGFQNPNCTSLSLNPFGKKAGRASALVGSIKMIFGAITSGVLSGIGIKSALPLAIISLVLYILSALLLFRYNKRVKLYRNR